MRIIIAVATLALLILPTQAQDWGTDFNMGTFAAGGGSAANGYLNLECPDESSGFDTAGQPFVTLTPMDGVVLNKKSVPEEGIAFWVDDDQSYLLPMSLEPSGNSLDYDYSVESAQSVRDMVEAMRKGDTVTAYAGGLDGIRLVMITLDGSAAALEFVEGCIAE